MKNTYSNPKANAPLRQKAEALLRTKPEKTGLVSSEVETFKLIHELGVHQIELEIQNEELVNALSAAKEAIELYDFAPVGYFTLSKEHIITNLNLCGSQMLGKERSILIGATFGYFISDNTKPVFNLFIDNIFNNRANESCEVTLSIKRDISTFVQLSGVVTKNSEQCLLTMVDITEIKRTKKTLMELAAILPICAHCKSIRNDDGGWKRLESFLTEHSDVLFTHSICPDCLKKQYPEVYDQVLNNAENQSNKRGEE